MTRIIKDWKPGKVEDTPVAPHRYLWTGTNDDYRDRDLVPRIRDAKNMVPYQPGEVVYVKDGDAVKRARIMQIHFEMDRYGDRREKFKVQFETGNGLWSKLFSYTYPGPVQRGYQKLGLAPEMPENA